MPNHRPVIRIFSQSATSWTSNQRLALGARYEVGARKLETKGEKGEKVEEKELEKFFEAERKTII